MKITIQYMYLGKVTDILNFITKKWSLIWQIILKKTTTELHLTNIWIATLTVKIGPMQLLIRWEYASKELCIGPRIYSEKRNFVCINPLHVYFIYTWNRSLRFEISKTFLPRKRKFCSLWYFQNNKQCVWFISNRSNIAKNKRYKKMSQAKIARCQEEYIAVTLRPPIKHTLKIVIFYYVFL